MGTREGEREGAGGEEGVGPGLGSVGDTMGAAGAGVLPGPDSGQEHARNLLNSGLPLAEDQRSVIVLSILAFSYGRGYRRGSSYSSALGPLQLCTP